MNRVFRIPPMGELLTLKNYQLILDFHSSGRETLSGTQNNI
jgi:hypothetical protein